MADSASRSLLTPADDYTKPRDAWTHKRTVSKLPLLITSYVALLIGCITATVAVLLVSHEDPVRSWKLQPSILLSILAGFYATLLGGILATGVAVSWWRSIAQGTTLKKLHYIHAGTSPTDFFSAFLAGSHARRVACTAFIVFAAKLAVGPMLQRSTRPSLRSATRSIDLNMRIAQEMPENWFGTRGRLSEDAVAVSQDSFLSRNIITEDMEGYRCPTPGTCEATIPGAGLNFNCTTSSTTINMLDTLSENATIFSIDLTMGNGTGLSVLYLDATYVSAVAEGCIATLTTETCMMIPATMEYPIFIEGHVITPDYATVIDHPEIVSNSTSAADEYTEDLSAPAGPLKGIEGAMSAMFPSRASLSPLQDGRASSYDLASGSKAAFWATMFLTGATSEAGYSDMVVDKCPLIWRSPRKFVLGHILDYMFRSAQAAANSSGRKENDSDHSHDDDKQRFKAVYKSEELWYITDIRWLAVSIAIMVFGAVAALSLLWGWWQLDRYVTLSPLETAKAFSAPVLSPADPELEASSIIAAVGSEPVAFDGGELVWKGSVYATGGCLRGRPHRDAAEPGLNRIDRSFSETREIGRRGHRRGHSSVSDASPSPPARPSFEHSRGTTTRRPYEDEEENDLGQYGHPRFRAYGDNTMPMPPSFAAFTQRTGGGPTLPPITPTGRNMEPLNPSPSPSPSGRSRKGSRGWLEVDAGGKRPLTRIEEGEPPMGGFF